MQTLRIENLTKTYGDKTLFQDASFIINEHDRIGLIGTNGSGKTTFLNAISGFDPADSGELIAPNNWIQKKRSWKLFLMVQPPFFRRSNIMNKH